MDKKSRFFAEGFGGSQDHGTLNLIPTSPELQKPCEEAVKALEQSFRQAGMTLKLCEALPLKGGEPSVLTEEDEHCFVEEAYQLRPSVGARFIVTNCGLYNYWFSHWYSGFSTALISIYDWDRIAPNLKVSSFIGYELLLHGLRTIYPAYQPELYLHKESKGCLFDYCQDKTQVILKLQSGILCSVCAERFNEKGINERPVRVVFESVRSLALSS